MAVTGYLLMFPFYGTDIAGMQLAQIVHGIVAVLFVAVMLAHIYIGTIGMEGAFEAMGDGTVDVNWAKEHHSLWLGRRWRAGPRVRRPPPRRKHAAGRIAGRESPSLLSARRVPPWAFFARRRGARLLYHAACASSASPAGAAPARPRC